MRVVETSYGKVEGIERGGVLQFLAIPFAAPPVGGQRWRPPQPPGPWTGVRPATSFGPVAPQGRPRFPRSSVLPTSAYRAPGDQRGVPQP